MIEKTFQMRPSRVLKKLRAGEVVYCTKIDLTDVRAVQIASMSGFDCLWTCMEHTANDWSVIERVIIAAKIHGVDTIVRTARGSYSDYIRPLELDAAGVMIPHIMSLEDAKTVIRHIKFHPVGLRPLAGGNTDAGFGALTHQEYIIQANEQRFNILQIEDVEPLNELEEIIALPGLDMIFFGPADFSQSIGVPGQLNHPYLLETRKRIADLAKKHGKFAGTVGSLENAATLIEEGYQFLGIGSDVIALDHYFKDLMQTLTKQNFKRVSSIYETDNKRE